MRDRKSFRNFVALRKLIIDHLFVCIGLELDVVLTKTLLTFFILKVTGQCSWIGTAYVDLIDFLIKEYPTLNYVYITERVFNS